jgi:hypothetical protein
MVNANTQLNDAIMAVCPIIGVAIVVYGDPASVEIQFDPAATDEQRIAAQGVLDSFEWPENGYDL